jgi:hypothetical protein
MNRLRSFAFAVLSVAGVLLAGGGPLAAAATGTRIIWYGSDGDDQQVDLGTTDPDTILQYGLAGNDTLYIAGQQHSDRLEQDGGDGHDNLSIKGGTGDDHVSQWGGNGGDSQFIEGGDGEDWVYQDGGAGDDEMYLRGGLGNKYLYQTGGTGDDSLRVDAGVDNDLVRMNGESGNDAITYDVSNGDDQVFIDGGTGSDTVTINGGLLSFTVLDAQGQVLYQRGTGGSVITVRNAECLQVLGPEGEVLYEKGCTYWGPSLGGTGHGCPGRVAVDESGNIYVIGTSGAPWGENPVRPFQGMSDAFVAKVSAGGALQWFTFLGSADRDDGEDIAVRGDAVFVVGTSYAAWGQNPVRPFQGRSDAFVAKLSAASGALLWHTFLGGTGPWAAGCDEGKAIALDGSGNVYLAGTSSAAWGQNPVRPFGGLRDAFAASLTANGGALQWHTFLGGAGIEDGADIATDDSGNVYVVGYSSDGWGDAPVRGHGEMGDAFVAKLNASGRLQWHTFLGGAGEDSGDAIIAAAGGDSIYAAGSSTAPWGEPLRPFSRWGDGFAVKLDGSGALQWLNFLGGAWNDDSDGLALDDEGNLYVKGSGDAGWGAPVRAYSSGYDMYVVRLDPAGAMQMLAFVGGEGDDFGDGIALDPGGNIVLAGMSDGVWGEPVQSYGDAPNALALKLSAGGELQWHTFFGGTLPTIYLPLVLK